MLTKIDSRPTQLLIVITAFFVANALIAECIGGKIFSLEGVFGLKPADFSLLGEDHLAISLTAGVILWPLEFVITDIVNEFYGPKIVRRISYIAVTFIAYAFIMFYMAIHLPAAGFWPATAVDKGVPDMNLAFSAVFGQGLWIIVGSIIAFLVAQVVDVAVFHKIKKITGEKKIWLRATGSTVVSQLVDSFIVLFIAFYIGQGWSMQKVLAICLVNYIYKFVVAILLTPVIYFCHGVITRYVGKERAAEMRQEAMGN
jgi:hypothetical protein